MGLLGSFISTNGQDTITKLLQSGFAAEDAKRFVPEAAREIVTSLDRQNGTSFSQASITEQENALLSAIDITDLANRLRLNSSLVTTGLTAIIPLFLENLQDNSALEDDMQSILGGSASEEHKTGIGGILGGLFRSK